TFPPQILKAPCLLLSLVTSLNLCSGKFGSPITDDVNKLPVLKQNIPYDYEIPVSYIPKEAGTCWVVLNIYPLEQSLRKLANTFGTISTNKDNVLLFIAMLKSLRFTLDHERLETAMQSFQCHYQEHGLLTGPYFDYIRDFLHTAAQGPTDFSCEPPPCLSTEQTPGTVLTCVNVIGYIVNNVVLAGIHEENRGDAWSRRSPLLLVLIPFITCVALIVWLVSEFRVEACVC
uniref:Kit ligand n=1 Tax=Oreochromis aureus TaxID=47969 RepID=A0A668UVJ0_OREAU